MKPRVVSGMRPTGKLHLGHLVGALNNWAALQDQYDCFYFVARDDVVRVELEAATGEPARHVLAEAGEVRVHLLAFRVIRERVLLVGAERELAARRAAQGKPRPGGGSGPACRDRQLEEALCERV